METSAPDPSRTARDGGLAAAFPELFQGLSEAAVSDLEAEFQRVHVTAGETLIRQGERADCMYLVVSGRLRAYVERSDGPDAAVGEIARGEIVGEMGLLIDEPRSATIRALRDSEVLRLSKEVFDRLIEKHPQALKAITRVNLMRLRRTILSPRMETPAATIAIVPAGRDAPVSEFARALAQALSAFGPTLHLDKAGFERAFGQAGGDPNHANGSVTAWLSEQESKFRCIVYESDSTRSSWTSRCLRQADHVLAVGRGGSDPAIGAAEAEIQPFDWRDRTGRRDLVLLHPDHTRRPSGTAAWLAARHVDGHHHVRMGSAADYARLARFLTGRAVGVVLGGGGARGMAHIGAMRALRERGIPIDLIGGTSSGALISAALAKGLDCETVLQQCKEQLRSAGSLLDVTLPLMSLVSGRRIARILDYAFADLMIEDLWTPYFCVSSNLTRARMMVHRRGSLRRAVRASISLPGILPPVIDDQDLLVDGGLMNKLPVDVMRGLCNGGKVVAMSISAAGALQAAQSLGEHVSGWGLLGRRLNPFRAKSEVPNIANILLCSTLVNSAQAQEVLEREADLCVQVTPPPIGLFDYGALDSMVEAGYQAALRQLESWTGATAGSPAARPAAEAGNPAGLPTLAEVFHPSF
jgi:NTE family protein/lysophospholipid hydrolase